MTQQNQDLKTYRVITMLPSYRAWWIAVRVLFVSAFAVGIIIFARNVSNSDLIQLHWHDYIRVVIVFNLLSELNIVLDNIAERFLPIPKYMLTRVALHLLLSILIGISAILYFENYLEDFNIFEDSVSRIMVVFGLIFVAFIIMTAVSLRITAKWVNSQKELEALKQEQLRYDYNALQDQLNPHFLFNNLSVLKSMIMYDQNAAIEFTQNFTDVYRYVLQSREKTTVKLSQELEFIHAYLGLHMERLGDGLKIKISAQKDQINKTIPPLSLQLLVENAIKHNIASADEPLLIEIISEQDKVVVSNNLNLKESSYSTQTGLENLNKRYELLTGIPIEISRSDSQFKVILPLFD